MPGGADEATSVSSVRGAKAMPRAIPPARSTSSRRVRASIDGVIQVSRSASVGLTALRGMASLPSLVLMNVAALQSPSSLRGLVSSPHRGLVEGAALVALYGVYELIRGGGNATLAAARSHTDSIVGLERHLHVFGEQALQNAAHAVPAL